MRVWDGQFFPLHLHNNVKPRSGKREDEGHYSLPPKTHTQLSFNLFFFFFVQNVTFCNFMKLRERKKRVWQSSFSLTPSSTLISICFSSWPGIGRTHEDAGDVETDVYRVPFEMIKSFMSETKTFDNSHESFLKRCFWLHLKCGQINTKNSKTFGQELDVTVGISEPIQFWFRMNVYTICTFLWQEMFFRRISQIIMLIACSCAFNSDARFDDWSLFFFVGVVPLNSLCVTELDDRFAQTGTRQLARASLYVLHACRNFLVNHPMALASSGIEFRG